MYNHMVGRDASVVSPFYFILLAYKLHLWSVNTADVHSESLVEGVQSKHRSTQGEFRIEGGGDRVSVHFAVTFLDC